MIREVVLLSGGVDSALCLWKLQRISGRAHAVFFDYGQPARDVERGSAWGLLEAFNRQYGRFFMLNRLKLPLQSDAMRIGVSARGLRIVPNRNAAMLAVVANHYPGANVYLGATAEDVDYPDCNQEFADAASELFGINVNLPLVDMSRSEVVEEATRRGVPMHLTWSCYEPVRELGLPRAQPCGHCNSCGQGRPPVFFGEDQ